MNKPNWKDVSTPAEAASLLFAAIFGAISVVGTSNMQTIDDLIKRHEGLAVMNNLYLMVCKAHGMNEEEIMEMGVKATNRAEHLIEMTRQYWRAGSSNTDHILKNIRQGNQGEA